MVPGRAHEDGVCPDAAQYSNQLKSIPANFCFFAKFLSFKLKYNLYESCRAGEFFWGGSSFLSMGLGEEREKPWCCTLAYRYVSEGGMTGALWENG